MEKFKYQLGETPLMHWKTLLVWESDGMRQGLVLRY